MRKIFLTLLTLNLIFLAACSFDFQNGDFEKVSITHQVSKKIGEDKDGKIIYERVNVTETFKVNPKVVAVFTLEVADIFLQTDLENYDFSLLGIAKSNLPPVLDEFKKDKYPNIGTLFEPNYDTLDLMLPDLIIIGGRSASLYETLKEKYPMADILDVSNTNYSFSIQKEVFHNIGLIFPNAKDILNQKILEFEEKILEINLKANGLNTLFISINEGQLSVFGLNSRYHTVFSDFGFSAADPNQETFNSHGNSVTFEYISAVNPDVILFMDRGAAIGTSGSIIEIINNPLILNTNAGKNSKIVVLDSYAWYILPGGLSSTETMIKDLKKVVE